MNLHPKFLLVCSIFAVLLIAVFSAGCTSVFEEGLSFFNGGSGSGSAANNPTDTTTKMTLSLQGNELTKYLEKYTTIPIGTVSGSPAQLSVSLKNGYKIVANPEKIVFTGAGKTITNNIPTQTTIINSGSKTMTITPHDGATVEENGKIVTTYTEDGGKSEGNGKTTVYKNAVISDWEGLKISLKDESNVNYAISEKNFYDDGGTEFDQKNVNSFRLTNGNSWKITQTSVKAVSKVYIDVNKNTATVKVQYYDPKYRKVTQSMSLTWNNGAWNLVKAIEYYDHIDKEELNG